MFNQIMKFTEQMISRINIEIKNGTATESMLKDLSLYKELIRKRIKSKFNIKVVFNIEREDFYMIEIEKIEWLEDIPKSDLINGEALTEREQVILQDTIFNHLFMPEKIETWAAIRDGKVIGVTTIEINEQLGKIHQLFVSPSNRNQGIAKELIQEVSSQFPYVSFYAQPILEEEELLLKKIGISCYQKSY